MDGRERGKMKRNETEVNADNRNGWLGSELRKEREKKYEGKCKEEKE